jgi:hypothetical protein
MRTVVALCAVALLVVGCGRVGNIRAPGPQDQITYPRVYPAPDRVPQPAPAARP